MCNLASSGLCPHLPTSFSTYCAPATSFLIQKEQSQLILTPGPLHLLFFLNVLPSSFRVFIWLTPQHSGLSLNVAFLWLLSLMFTIPILSHSLLHHWHYFLDDTTIGNDLICICIYLSVVLSHPWRKLSAVREFVLTNGFICLECFAHRWFSMNISWLK